MWSYYVGMTKAKPRSKSGMDLCLQELMSKIHALLCTGTTTHCIYPKYSDTLTTAQDKECVFQIKGIDIFFFFFFLFLHKNM